MTPLEPTPANLRQKYIVENVPLESMGAIFGMPKGTLRKRLDAMGIKKTQKAASANATKAKLDKYGPNFFVEQYARMSDASRAKAHQNSVESRRRNKLESLASEGITYDALYDRYIVKNWSMKKVGEEFGRTKQQVRKLLTFFGIKKTEENYQLSRERGKAELWSDPERARACVLKTQSTIRERYGASWYYNHASKFELEILDFVVALLPVTMEVRSGDYRTIRRESNNAALQLDILIPELKVAIEADGAYYHDRKAYERETCCRTLTIAPKPTKICYAGTRASPCSMYGTQIGRTRMLANENASRSSSKRH